jgi:hypothetical protein
MNNLFRSLSEERQAGLKRVIAAARQNTASQREILRDQSEARALQLSGRQAGAVEWELRTDECGAIARGVWPKDVSL